MHKKIRVSKLVIKDGYISTKKCAIVSFSIKYYEKI